MARKYELEDGRPEDWREDVVYIRNPDGTISVLTEEGDPDDADNS